MKDFALGSIVDKQRTVELHYSEKFNAFKICFTHNNVPSEEVIASREEIVQVRDNGRRIEVNVLLETMEGLVQLYMTKLLQDYGADIATIKDLAFEIHWNCK